MCISFHYWGQVTHICVCNLTIIGSDIGLSQGQCQAIIWTNAGILLNQSLATNFSEILSKIHILSFKKMHLKISAKRQPFGLGLNVLNCPCKKGQVYNWLVNTIGCYWVKPFINSSTIVNMITIHLMLIINPEPIRMTTSSPPHATNPSGPHQWWEIMTQYNVTSFIVA